MELLNDSVLGGALGICLLLFSIFLWGVLHK